MPAGKGFDRAHLGRLNGREVAKDHPSDLVSGSGRDAILPGAAREGTRTLELSTAPGSQGAEPLPGKVVGMRLLRGSQLASSFFQVSGTSTLKVTTQGITTALQEDTESLP